MKREGDTGAREWRGGCVHQQACRCRSATGEGGSWAGGAHQGHQREVDARLGRLIQDEVQALERLLIEHTCACAGARQAAAGKAGQLVHLEAFKKASKGVPCQQAPASMSDTGLCLLEQPAHAKPRLPRPPHTPRDVINWIRQGDQSSPITKNLQRAQGTMSAAPPGASQGWWPGSPVRDNCRSKRMWEGRHKATASVYT